MDAPLYARIRKPLTLITRVYFLYMVYALLWPRPYVPHEVKFSLTHFCAFGVLAGMVFLVRARWSRLVWFALLLLWGVSSEFLQRYTGRCFEWLDMAQNVAGTTTGIICAIGLRAALDRALKNVPVKNARPGAVAVLFAPPTRLSDKIDLRTCKTLVIRRSQRVAAPGKLCFPGGGVEPGESPEDAVRREFREEVGLELGETRCFTRNLTPVGGALYWFFADVVAERPEALDIRVQQEEVAGYEWRTLPELMDDPNFLENNLAIVKGIVEGKFPV